VLVQDNRIQGNLAGAGDGGGIAVRYTNQDAISIEGNVIVNNVSGLAGGGLSLLDAANVSITGNTIARNDSTATASEAFSGGPTISTEQPAGIVSRAHSAGLNQQLGVSNGFSDPDPFTGNIIWQNRSFYWEVGIGLREGTPLFWDLGVLGAVGPMNPVDSVLTSLTGPDGADYSGSGNSIADPLFADPYFNIARGLLVLPEPTTGIETAVALDEGGNAIDVAFGPLTLTGDYTATGTGAGAAGTAGVLAVAGGSNPSGSRAATATAGIGGASGGGSCFITTASPGLSEVLAGCVVAFAVLFAAIGLGLKGRIRRGIKATLLGLVLTTLTTAVFFVLGAASAQAEIVVQCPGDIDGDAVPDPYLADGETLNPDYDPDVVCMHVAAGDGFVNMADGRLQYIFSFSDVTGIPENEVTMRSMVGATFPAPTIKVPEGKKFYLTLTNVGMMVRPDLFDPHTVHFHGFPNAASVFDGVPSASISINMGASLTYFFYLVEPGTFMWHCHVEATEHMQMGMLGQIYVTPTQDGTEYEDPDGSGRTYTMFAYNDGDGSTGYDVDYPIQIASFDPDFHDASFTVQPLPFAMMEDKYPMLNGRGYPDTCNISPPRPRTSALSAP
jgi:hypothetical protein